MAPNGFDLQNALSSIQNQISNMGRVNTYYNPQPQYTPFATMPAQQPCLKNAVVE